MNRKPIALVFFLLAATTHGFAQSACNLQLVPEGDNPCLLDGNYDFSVIRACRGNTVNYRAHASSAIGYEWTVVGGDYQLTDDGTVCQVTWGDGDDGMVSVDALRPDSSVCTRQLRIELGEKPTAGVISMPNYVVDVNNPQKKWIEVCAGDTLSFVDNSTSTDNSITDYYWEYPYGASTSRSISFVARDPGHFQVVHRVYNECGCYDEVSIEIIVNEECPLELSCFGTVCAYSTQYYILSAPDCSDYLWNVQGGTITNSQHRPGVEVLWDAPESGFGTLYLDGTSCDCECESRKSIKIPVISDNVNINGPDLLCVYNPYTFSVPLWGATQYSWSVTPSTGIEIRADHNNLTLIPHQNRTFTISVTFACDFLGCGPYTVSKTITVRDPLTISASPSAENVCIGSQLTFSTNTPTASLWTVKLNDSVIRTVNAPTLVHTFDTSGSFVIQAMNDGYCDEATLIVPVKGKPPVPSSISGPDTICPLFTAEYSATPSSPDNYILWEWTAFGATHTYAGNQANITFGSTVNDINVYQVNRKTGCRSEAAVYPVAPFQLAVWPYTDTIRVCQGQTFTLSSLRDQSDYDVLYEWKVLPANVLSIQGSHLTANITLMSNYTNNLPTTARAILKRMYCGTYQYDTVYVRVGEIGIPTITHDLVCAGQNTFFSVSGSDFVEADRDSTYWYIDNHTGNRKIGPMASFVINDTDTHIVHLHYVSTYGCEVDTYDTVVPCPPLPDMHVDTSNNMLSVVIEGDPAGYSYLWMTNETTPSIVAPPDSFWCVVTSPDCGCSRRLSHQQYVPDSGCIYVDSAFTIAHHCNNIISIVNLAGPGLGYPVSVTLSQHNYSRSFTVADPYQNIMVPDVGVYFIEITWTSGGSCYYSTFSDSIVRAVQMQIINDCHGNMVINCNQAYGGPIPIDVTVAEAQSNTIVGSDSGTDHARIPISNTGWYLVHIIFGNPDCYIDTLVHFDAVPTIQSINVGSRFCINTAFTFSANASGSNLTYEWNFGDGSWNFGNDIDHVFDHPLLHNIILTVTDRNDCRTSGMVSVRVVNNPLGNEYEPENMFPPTCPGDSAVLQTGQGDNLYSWYPCSQFTDYTANVYEAGTYIVDITTINEQCRKQYAINVPYPNGPFASIIADNSYCVNDMAEFKGDIGSGYDYRWYIHAPHFSDSSTSADFSYRLTDTGYHQVILWVSTPDGCSSSDTVRFYVHPTPPAPELLLCDNPCITKGPVKVCSPNGVDLLWSNGTQGTSTLYFTDGTAEAYYIDAVTGCRSNSASIYIPEAPDFDGLLTGCYCIDFWSFPAEMSLFSLGSSDRLSWEWRRFNSTVSSGIFPPSPASLSIPTEGEYRLLVTDYGLGCSAESPALTIESLQCKHTIQPNELPPVWATIVKKNCRQSKCSIIYEIVVSVCNGSDAPVCIDDMTTASPVSYTVNSVLPIVLNPGECRDISFKLVYDFSSPSSVLFTFRCGGVYVGVFAVDLSDWMECVTLDSCTVNAAYALALDQSLSHPNQSAFFHFDLAFPSLSGNVISVWSDQGQVIDSNNSGSSYSGLLMMDYGLMTQMVVDSADFCFHFICCSGDSLCFSDICISYWKLWEICEQLGARGSARMMNPPGSPLAIGEEEKTFLLVPNPATGIVSVVRKKDIPASDDIRLIEVFALNGQKVLSLESSHRFDASRLADGNYIVKVVTTTGGYEYLKLTKQ